MGDARKHSAFDSGKSEVTPIGGDRQIDAKWMDGKHGTESIRLRLKVYKCGNNQNYSNVDNKRQVCSVFHNAITWF